MPTPRAILLVCLLTLVDPLAAVAERAAAPVVDEAGARATATSFIAALEQGDAAAIERLLAAPVTTSLAPLAELSGDERSASKACQKFEKARTVQRAALKVYARCLAERRTAATHHELSVAARGARLRVESAPPETYMPAPDEEGIVLELERVRGAYRIRAVRIEGAAGGVEGGGPPSAE